MSSAQWMVLFGLLLTVLGDASAQSEDETPRTAWGHPDLQGVWTNVGVTPLERPSEFGERQLLTDEEVAALEEEAGGLLSFRQQTDDARNAGDPLDPQRLDRQGLNYNSVWYQQKRVSRYTSLIVDPPDGRIPPFTPRRERNAQLPVWKRTSAAGSTPSGAGDVTAMSSAVCGNAASRARCPGSPVPTTTISSFCRLPATWSCSWR